MKYIATIFVTIVILTAVLWPGSQIPTTRLPIDKLVHFLLFAGWTSAIILDFDVKWVKALLFGVLFAFLTEIIQLAAEDRTFDMNDVFADTAGVLFAIANSGWIIKLAKRVLRR